MEQHGKREVWSAIRISAMIAIILCVIISKCFPLTYGINDDVAMRDIAAGAVSGSPDGHLIFVKYVLGAILAFFYQIFPGVDWYGCIWIGLIVLCISLLLYQGYLYCLIKNKKFLHFVLAFFFVFIILGLKHLVSFQFTIVSAMIAGTAIFSYSTIRDENGQRKYLAVYGGVLVLMWIAYCVRFEVFWMAAPFAGFIVLFKNTPVKNKVGFLAAALIGILVISGIEHLAYSDKEWKDYLEYNQYRSNVFDFYGVPTYEENVEFYQSIGMEEYDVINLSRYSLYLVEGIETGKMQQISDYAQAKWEKEHGWARRVKDGIKCAVKGFLEPENILLNIVAKGILLCNLIYEFRKRKKTFFLNTAFLVVEGIFWIYLGFHGRLPARVGGALLFIAAFSAASVFYQEQFCEQEWKEKSFVVRMILSLLVIGTAFCEWGMIQKKQEELCRRNQEWELLEEFFEQNKENVYFLRTDLFSGNTDNFRIFNTFQVSNGFKMGGWSAFSPLRKKGLEQYGILNVDKAIIENDNAYLVMPTISTRIEEHYQKKYGGIIWEECGVTPVSSGEIPIFRIEVEE